MASEDLFVEEFSEEVVPISENHKATNSIPEIISNESEEIVSAPSEIASENLEATSASDNQATREKETTSTERENKLFQLPMSRIKNLMKLDPDLHLASHEAIFLVTRATELFIESLARESYTYTAQAKKKTVQKRDVDLAIAAVDSLMFLDGAMNF